MGQYTSLPFNRRGRPTTASNGSSPVSTPIPSNTATQATTNDHLSILRRRRSSNNTLGPPARRRRFPERFHGLLVRNEDNSLRTEDESLEATPDRGFIQHQLDHHAEDRTENERRFMDELDTIASDLFNAVSADPSPHSRHLTSLSSVRSNESSASVTRHTRRIRNQGSTDEEAVVSLESQITMLSRLLEVASTSTLYTLLGRSNPVGRRFDNTTRNENRDSTFQEFLESLRNGLLTRELGNDGDETRENMSFFRAFRFDTLNEENTQESPVPVMIVGVRSVQQPINEINNELAGGSFPGSTMADSDDADRADAQSIHSRRSIASSFLNTENTLRTPDQELQVETNQRSWVIFVMGNTFVGNHPLLSAPSLLSENPTYEDLMNLQELLGQEKPQVAKEEDLKEDLLSEIKISNSFELKTEFAPKVILQGERCQICLSDYGDGEVVRKLGNCDHFYHKDCIETWLLNGKNNCPLCRSKGVGETEVAG